MSSNDLGQTLKRLEQARTQLLAQIAESQAVLDAIEERIETVRRQSTARLLNDERVDNNLLTGLQESVEKAD